VTSPWSDLASEVIRRAALDQAHRHGPFEVTSDDERQRQREIDDDNRVWLRPILRELGWPWRTAIGAAAADGFWLLVQHCNDAALMEEALVPLRLALRADEVRRDHFAMLEDRLRVVRGRKQLYGSQLRRFGDVAIEPFPIERPAYVEQRRATVDLPPLSWHIASLRNRTGGRIHGLRCERCGVRRWFRGVSVTTTGFVIAEDSDRRRYELPAVVEWICSYCRSISSATLRGP